MEAKSTFGDKIAQGRKKKGMSQEDLANELNVSRQMVSRWELNTAMPRMQKIKKISEILDISIEELLSGNENKKFVSPVALNSNNLKTLLKVIAVFLATILILYVVYSSYKIIILNKVSSKLEQYKNLDNYYFRIKSYTDGELQETNEIWYKDGKYKLKHITIINSAVETTITYLNINEKLRYIIDEEHKTYSQFNLIVTDIYENGNYMYDFFPTVIKSGATSNTEIALKLNRVWAYYKGESLFIYINNESVEVNRRSFMPISRTLKMQENKNSQVNSYLYDIQLDSAKDEDVNIPTDFTKLN